MTRALLTSAILLVSVTASAQQDPVFIQDDGNGVQPQQQQQYQQQQVQPQPAQPAVAERGARQTGLYLTSPIFLTDPSQPSGGSWDPGFGIGIGGRFGWEFGMLVPEVHIGIQTNFSGATLIDAGGTYDANRITAFHFSIGARLQFVNPSRFLPFVAVAFRGNFWGYTDEFGDGSVEYDFNPAASGTVGLAVELSQTVGLEAAVDVVANFGIAASNEPILDGTDVLLIPRLGGTLYF